MKKLEILLLFSAFSSVFGETVTVTSTRNYRIPTTAAALQEDNARPTTVTISTPNSGATETDVANVNSITSCHLHGATQYCIDQNGDEGYISPGPTNTVSAPTLYTSCHTHSESTFCISEDDSEVMFVKDVLSSAGSESSGGKNCHFHAGVEHCVEEGESESNVSCEKIDRDYNISLRVGLLFAILAGSAFGVYSPIFISSWLKFNFSGVISNCLKQFGTGIIISTAFVHLITHANLMWSNSCITLSYEATGQAITMAGLFISFLVEYFSFRLTSQRRDSDKSEKVDIENNDLSNEESLSNEVSLSTESLNPSSSQNKLTCIIIECGILFHSILIGITLVVAGDSYFITLFIVILFHQMFEGIALGLRIAELNDTRLLIKCIMAFFYAVITPIGMAIGIGVLHRFNGNDKSTIIALGTLDSFSAGILIWTGLVNMWYKDWIQGSLISSSPLNFSLSLFSLLAGLILMSVLGKWA